MLHVFGFRIAKVAIFWIRKIFFIKNAQNRKIYQNQVKFILLLSPEEYLMKYDDLFKHILQLKD